MNAPALQQSGPDPLLCWLWLAHTLGPGNSHAGRVLDVFGGAQQAWEARDTDAFRQAAGAAAARRVQKPGNTPDDYAELVMTCDALGVEIISFESWKYPLALTRIPDMPLVLYCTGDSSWLNVPGCIGIVGSRKPTGYGVQAAEDLGRAMARAGAVIVSGLADGLDSVGHRAAIEEQRPTIAVLGNPIDHTYPASNLQLRSQIEQNGCVISEYAPYTGKMSANCFLQRNRLIAALSSALLVVEAQEKSGTMSTVDYAQSYGRPVFAVPGSIYSPSSMGTNRLLSEGRARAAFRAKELLAALGLQEPSGAERPAAPRVPPPLSENERRVLSCIGPQPRGIEELGLRSGLPTPVLMSILTKLELSGQVERRPGAQYILR
ncbi:MAG: DNA-processing protein DprA [Faecalibacterium sp.]